SLPRFMLRLMVSRPAAPFPAQAGRISVQNECAKGATYWCRNLMTAVQCGALEHCVEAGWSPATGEGCLVQLRGLASPAVTAPRGAIAAQESIQKYLEQECAALPVQTLVPQCQTLVDTYYVLFIASLEVQLVSVAAGPPHDAVAPAVRWFGTRDDFPIPLPTCWLCTTFMGKIESAIPKGAIGKAISQLCRILPAAIAGMCQCLMERYTEIIVDMLVAKLGPSLICGMLFMCATEENCGPSTLPSTGALPASWGNPHLPVGWGSEGWLKKQAEVTCDWEQLAAPRESWKEERVPFQGRGRAEGSGHPADRRMWGRPRSSRSNGRSVLLSAELPQVVLPVPADACRACLGLTRHAQVALGRNRTEAAAEAALLSACSSAFLDGQQASALRGEGGAAVPFTQPVTGANSSTGTMGRSTTRARELAPKAPLGRASCPLRRCGQRVPGLPQATHGTSAIPHNSVPVCVTVSLLPRGEAERPAPRPPTCRL
uniref:Pulmonary surfactant-associated protein B n=1 Tax=Varanus komodoensis TaxID=61221 RepID=A0A8D2JHJ2_VARKO